jgi:hypothetical protein
MGNNLNGTSVRQPDPHLAEVIRSAEQELHCLLKRRTDIVHRITTVKQTLNGLAEIFGNEMLGEELKGALGGGERVRSRGFTQACRTLLMESEQPVGAQEMCARLQARFPELLRCHKDPVASVTTVMSRLVGYGEARRVFNDQNRRFWQCVTNSDQNGTEGPRLRSHVRGGW